LDSLFDEPLPPRPAAVQPPSMPARIESDPELIKHARDSVGSAIERYNEAARASHSSVGNGAFSPGSPQQPNSPVVVLAAVKLPAKRRAAKPKATELSAAPLTPVPSTTATETPDTPVKTVRKSSAVRTKLQSSTDLSRLASDMDGESALPVAKKTVKATLGHDGIIDGPLVELGNGEEPSLSNEDRAYE
jgi:hypothetical protein